MINYLIIQVAGDWAGQAYDDKMDQYDMPPSPTNWAEVIGFLVVLYGSLWVYDIIKKRIDKRKKK